MEIISSIEKKDIPVICDWHKDHVAINFPDSKYKREMFKELVVKAIGKDTSCLVKRVVNRKMVGWLWLNMKWDDYKDLRYCDLHYIHIDKKYRGKGYGKDLMKFADDWAKFQGMKEIRLGTSVDNIGAIELYKKYGYKVKRVLMEKKT